MAPRLRPPSKEESQLLPPYEALDERAIFVPATEAEFAQARATLLAQSALGFDTESRPVFQAGQPDTGPHVVQLATPQAAWILQLHHPQALALACEVMASPSILKVGFGLSNDLRTLPQRLGTPLVNVLDLDKVFRSHGYGHNVGVRAAMALVLERSFTKSKRTSTSNWAARQLSPAQIRYAANDAHAPALIHAALPAWQARQPQAPRAARPQRPRPARPASPSSPPLPSIPPHHNHPSLPMRWLLRGFAVLCLALGIAGVFLPGLPTTVFILMASWAAARSSPRIHAWLHRHRLFGPMLRNWEAGGYVSRRAKHSAAITMAISAVILWWLTQPWWVPALATSCMVTVLLWLWRRPEPPTARG